MKVLIKDKIVEDYRFPLSEALSFSILIWTLWGLAESFLWHFFLPFLDPLARTLDQRIYIVAFALYLAIGCLMGVLCYAVSRGILIVTRQYQPYLFRALSLATILFSFFFVVLQYNLRRYLPGGGISPGVQKIIVAGVVLLATGLTILLFTRAAKVGFRIRRPGATMLSIFVFSALFSFVSFPLFSAKDPDPKRATFKTSADYIMAYHYLQALLQK